MPDDVRVVVGVEAGVPLGVRDCDAVDCAVLLDVCEAAAVFVLKGVPGGVLVAGGVPVSEPLVVGVLVGVPLLVGVPVSDAVDDRVGEGLAPADRLADAVDDPGGVGLTVAVAAAWPPGTSSRASSAATAIARRGAAGSAAAISRCVLAGAATDRWKGVSLRTAAVVIPRKWRGG